MTKLLSSILIGACLWIDTASGTGQTSLYQQQVENAVPDQAALDHAKKKLAEHKDVTIQDKPIIQSFHKQLGELETAPNAFCRNCHLPLPHQKQLRNRAFNNMHVRFIACETCHFRPKDLKFDYLWFDYEHDQTVDGQGLFRVAQKLDNGKQRPVNPKIAPLHKGQRAFATKADDFSQAIAARWEKADEAGKVELRAKIHWPLEKKGPNCQDCHDENKSLLNFNALGASIEEQQAISKHMIPKFFRLYQKDEQKITIRDMLR